MRGFDALSMALHVISIMLLVALMFGLNFADPTLVEKALDGRSKGDVMDAINIAVQIGRLDFVSMTLTAIGALIGFTSIIGYVELRHRAVKAAQEETRKYLDEMLGPMVRREVDSQLQFARSAGPEESSAEVEELKRALDEKGGSNGRN